MQLHLCAADGLGTAYSGPVPFQRDGLYMLHKEGHYSLASTPLAVLWKDSLCSRYFIDTDAAGVVPERQVRMIVADTESENAAVSQWLMCACKRSCPNMLAQRLKLVCAAECHIGVSHGPDCGNI